MPAKAAASKKTAAQVPVKRAGGQPIAKKVKGKILFYDQATGRGVIETEDEAEKNIDLDVARTKILNKGYVRLDAGREVTVFVDDEDRATDLMAE